MGKGEQGVGAERLKYGVLALSHVCQNLDVVQAMDCAANFKLLQSHIGPYWPTHTCSLQSLRP